MRAPSVAVIVMSALVLVACGTNAKKNARGPAERVADTVSALQQDLVTRNWADICAQVYSSKARAQAGGDSCPAYVRRGAAGLRSPHIRVRKVDVGRGRASAHVITTAAGQAEVPETIELVLEGGKYRVAALGGR
jgi:hypothetical protein